jgi:hypothetical protein
LCTTVSRRVCAYPSCSSVCITFPFSICQQHSNLVLIALIQFINQSTQHLTLNTPNLT